MKILFQAAAVACAHSVLCEALTAQQQPPSQNQPDLDEQFDEIPNVFALMDTDEDRHVSREEYIQFFKEQGVEQDMRGFAQEDVDKDDRISYEEFLGPKGDPEHDAEYMRNLANQQRRISLRDDLFTAMDANADHQISRQELSDFFTSQGQVAQEGLFESEDKDSDGVISWDEFSGPKGAGKAAGSQTQAPQQQKKLPNLFVEMDANRDSRITKRELLDYFEAHTSEEPDPTLFSREDADGNGWISWEEFSGPKGSAPPNYKAQKTQRNIFRDMDEDDDARVSHAEFHRYFEEVAGQKPAAGLWEREDKDSDGFLSWDEFSGPKGETRPEPGSRYDDEDATFEQPVIDINLFASMDVNNDKAVTLEEMDAYFERATGQPSAPSLFAVEDKNGDGKISWEEFSGPKGTSPDDREKAATPEEVKALNAANAAHASEQVAASNDSDSLNLFAEMDANGDGRVSKDEMDSYFVDITGEPEASGLFEEEDKNGDGFIDFDEFGGPKGENPALETNIFVQMDADDSRTITRIEFDNYFKVVAQGVPEPGFFESEDANSDGVISWEEFSGPKGESPDDRRVNLGAPEEAVDDADLFSELDLDGDRQVAWQEFKTFFEYHNQPVDEKVFRNEDHNNDGVITWTEFSGPKGVEDVKPRNFFAEMDIEYGNSDGKIQRAEMNVWYMVNSGESQDCPDELWDSSDKNGDGVVTWDEFDDLKGTILERPADDHQGPGWVAPDAQPSDLGPLQTQHNAQCWTRQIAPNDSNDEARDVLQCLPDFIVIGTARSASTTLYDLLAAHPSTEMFDDFQDKELNFWNTVPMCQPFDYAMLLPPIDKGADLVTAEGSVRYFLHPMVPPRIKHYIPDTKFLVSLRNPVYRMFSHWRMEHFLMKGRDPREDFHTVALEELAKQPEDAAEACFPASRANANAQHCFAEMANLWNPDTVEGAPYTNYLDWSTYHYQLDRWLAHFPLSQFKFVSFNEMKHTDSIDEQMGAVHAFLDLPAHSYKDENGNIRTSNVNDEGLDAELEARTLKLLRDFFEPHNKAFYAQVGIDFGWEKEIDDHLAQLEAKGEL